MIITKPQTKPSRKTKTALVREILTRPDGAKLEELCKATGWQAHTVRAALSGLRKAGHIIEPGNDDAGQSVYRISTPEEAGQ
ncbi:DUF3489 domain-containing protein [Roseovarius pacificus]|uniref:DUF3489 domain-containing protein n=1 Tax=Roseovarius pacificus TaxID=337701 RepID=UPI002A18D66D|nr:DUF3489 domain-containing protein [Roseovarius pacificus]